MQLPGTRRATRRRRRRTLAHELIPLALGSAFAVRRFTTSHWPLNWHDHPELELTWIVRGRGLRYVADAVSEFAPGDLVLLGPGVAHAWASEAGPGNTCESVVAQFPLDVLGVGWRDVAELRPLAELFAHAAYGVQLFGATAITVQRELAALATDAPGPLRMARLLAALGAIAAAPLAGPIAERRAIARLAGSPIPGTPLMGTHRGDPWAGLLRHLHEHADEPLAMADLAARQGLSPPSFARAFRRRFGTTCTDYRARIRLARVCRELLDPQRSIARLAYAAGFANLAGFNRRFRAVYGVTPTVWRERQLRR